MKQLLSKFTITFRILITALLSGAIVTSSWATGPRITEALLSPNENQIYSHDFPPFTTTELETGGFVAEIIDAVLDVSNIDAVQTIVPLQSMVKFHLNQEKALSVYGRHLNFNKKEKKKLIYIPIAVSRENYIYYKPVHKAGLSWNGKLSSLKGYTYGANKGEPVKKIKKAKIKIKYSRTNSLLKKMISKKVDFMAISNLNLNWELNKNFPNEKNNFVTFKNSIIETPIYIVFNKKHAKGKIIARKFKKGLTTIIKNGKYVQIAKKYISDTNAQIEYMATLKKLRKKYK